MALSIARAEAIGEVCRGGLAPNKPLIMDKIFFKKESVHGTYYIP